MSFDDKVAHLRLLMQERNLQGIVLRRSPNVAWLIGGRAHVAMVVDAGCLDVVITPTSVRAITNRIEANRLQAEELPASVDVEFVDWQQGRDGLLPTGAEIGSDTPGADRADLGKEIESLRQVLDAADRERFEQICRDAASALGAAMKAARTDDREVDIAGRIASALWSADLEPVVLLVAGERRAPLMRHPLPTTDVVGARAIGSICARRKGLIASVTRVVAFAEFTEAQWQQYDGLLAVEGAMLDATKPGSPFSAVLEAARAAYPNAGFAADEWTKHHQGGPTGFLPRDWPATLTSASTMRIGQPVAWNPTAAGLKVEDTWVVESDGPRLLSLDRLWPTREAAGRARPTVWRSGS